MEFLPVFIDYTMNSGDDFFDTIITCNDLTGYDVSFEVIDFAGNVIIGTVSMVNILIGEFKISLSAAQTALMKGSFTYHIKKSPTVIPTSILINKTLYAGNFLVKNY